MKKGNLFRAGILILFMVFLSFPGYAQEQSKTKPDTDDSIIQNDEELLKELEKELSVEGKSSATGIRVPKIGFGALQLMDISFDALFAGGGSSVEEPEILNLQGGGHDPKKQGFTIQNLELSLLGAVDPYFNMEAHLIYLISPEGESEFEVEEAFATTNLFPWGLQLKVGMFFTEFGRINAFHPHAWNFVDLPLINYRLFGGDGLRAPGARLSWLLPTPWYSEVIYAVQNANGETVFSFLGEAGSDFSGFPILEQRVKSLKGLLHTGRWLNSLNLSQTITMNLGFSGAFGPNGTAFDNRTTIVGSDLYVKWRKRVNQKGFPFLSWQTEGMLREYEAGAAKETLEDYGFYSELLWGYAVSKTIGIRVESVGGDGEPADPLRDQRNRFSLNHTWYPTEFSKVRLQYNFDDAEHLENNGHSFWIQGEFLIGKHATHKF